MIITPISKGEKYAYATDKELEKGITITDTAYTFNNSRIFDTRDYSTIAAKLKHVADVGDFIYLFEDRDFYRFNLDGSGKKLIGSFGDGVAAIASDGKYIFGSQASSGNVYRKNRIDGSNAGSGYSGWFFNASVTESGFTEYSGRLYYLDTAVNQKIYSTTTSGTDVREEGNLVFVSPRGLTAQNGKLYVLDQASIYSVDISALAPNKNIVFARLGTATDLLDYDKLSSTGDYIYALSDESKLKKIRRYDIADGANGQDVFTHDLSGNVIGLISTVSGDITFSFKTCSNDFDNVEELTAEDFDEYVTTKSSSLTTLFQNKDLPKNSSAEIMKILNLHRDVKAILLEVKTSAGAPLMHGAITLI